MDDEFVLVFCPRCCFLSSTSRAVCDIDLFVIMSFAFVFLLFVCCLRVAVCFWRFYVCVVLFAFGSLFLRFVCRWRVPVFLFFVCVLFVGPALCLMFV